VGSSLIHPADGGAHFEVVFRLVVFKPYVGEVISGKVLECSKDGIKVGLDFFTNCFIPYYHLFEPSSFDEAKKTWVWDDSHEDEEEEDDDEPLAIQKGDMINFEVHDVNFTGKTYSVKGVHTMESKVDASAAGAPVRKRSQSFDKGRSWEEGGNLRRERISNSTTMEVVGIMRSDGLGKNEWWENDDDDEDEEDGEDDMD
jgi:DNA-directed RNA polymerase III subunit RPC8